MSLWVEDALKQLATLDERLNVDAIGQRCQEQITFCYRMEYLKNIAGSANAYRDACQAALDCLLPAVELQKRIDAAPLPIKPLDDDHPKVKDDWERARQRRQKELDERNKMLAAARGHLEDAAKIAKDCLEWRPEHTRREEKAGKK